jgi:hypothetical protein
MSSKWQWSWNTPMNSVTEKWLNDKSLAAGGIELLCDNGGALNVGENGYRQEHYHDSIGMVATLITTGELALARQGLDDNRAH